MAGSHGEWRSLMGLVLLLALCSMPHGYRLLRETNPSDATIGWWLQRLYFAIQGMWLAVFVVRTRGDPTIDDDVAAVHTVLGDFPGGLGVHLWLPIVGSVSALLFFLVTQLTDPGRVTVRDTLPLWRSLREVASTAAEYSGCICAAGLECTDAVRPLWVRRQ